MRLHLLLPASLILACFFAGRHGATAQGPKKEVIPHGQSQPPGPPLSPAEAIKKMQVPPGFHVELVAAEPNLVNPVAMTFDEKGCIWITESVEYPRHSPGPGKDRVKLFESTKGDGNYDKVTTIIDGLNIPSGIAVGHGGVWVANSPDILFYPFDDRDTPKLGKPQVVVTGFGRSDTHELPNSLTWGPDGYLYGLNGVFNPSVVKQDGKEWRFTCALFRIHPKTKKFDIFCEGTSNPWGLAFNENGDAFVSACVIDHLWHLTETGYYHRQGGPYPPFTWKIESIVKHRHQKAAYCGLCYFDSDAYPAEYRGKLYMGNIHGGCINCDELTRDGSTYLAKPRPDFLTANDAWFMPVAQKVGPDGCLYILDWYDRYHCYQDAGRDPKGIDRLRGRLYRVVYTDYKPAGKFDLHVDNGNTFGKHVAMLASPNLFFRETAQRTIAERLGNIATTGSQELIATEKALRTLVQDKDAAPHARMHALWVLLSGGYTTEELLTALLESDDARFRAWGVRHLATLRGGPTAKYTQVAQRLARDRAPVVQLQVAIGARKFDGGDPLPVLLDVLAHCGDDKLIPHIVWQNLHPLLEWHGEEFIQRIAKLDLEKSPAVARLLPRVLARVEAANTQLEVAVITALVAGSRKSKNRSAYCECLEHLAVQVQYGEIAGKRLEALRVALLPLLRADVEGDTTRPITPPGVTEANLLLATLGDPHGTKAAHRYLTTPAEPEPLRLQAVKALITIGAPDLINDVAKLLDAPKTNSIKFRSDVLAALSRLDQPQVGDVVLRHYAAAEPELQPKMIELLTERPTWSKRLLSEIAQKKIPSSALNANQVRKLLASKDKDLVKQVTAVWGTLRTDRNPEREKIVAQMRDLIKRTPGDAKVGAQVFRKVCAQCHKIYGEGADVGPDVTSNGRSDFEQLLSNVFDPSLVIGAGYQATTVVTSAGQVLTGLVVEESPQRVVLKVQGGELKTVPRGSVDEIVVSKVSLMPEGLERQLQPQEIADLFAFLCLDRPPDDPKARKIPGTPR